MLRHYGVKCRGGRFDCPFCKGTGTRTAGCNERIWNCFRCAAKGDVFALVMKLERCTFPEALRTVAELAGVSAARAVNRTEIRKRWQCRQRIDSAAAKLVRAEHKLRLSLAQRVKAINFERRVAGARLRAAVCHGKPERFPGEAAACEAVLAAAPSMERETMAAYAVLSYAAARERAEFILKPAKRMEMVATVLEAGAVVDDHGRHIEAYLA